MEEYYIASVPDRIAAEVLTYLNTLEAEYATKSTTTGYTEIYALKTLSHIESVAKKNYVFGVMDVLINKTPY